MSNPWYLNRGSPAYRLRHTGSSFIGEGDMLVLERVISNWIYQVTKKSPSNIKDQRDNSLLSVHCLVVIFLKKTQTLPRGSHSFDLRLCINQWSLEVLKLPKGDYQVRICIWFFSFLILWHPKDFVFIKYIQNSQVMEKAAPCLLKPWIILLHVTGCWVAVFLLPGI